MTNVSHDYPLTPNTTLVTKWLTVQHSSTEAKASWPESYLRGKIFKNLIHTQKKELEAS